MKKTVGIVSLSRGLLGEDFVRHELELGVRRLESLGLEVRFAPHALRGLDYLRDHPEKRAEDLLWAFREREVDRILCAIGGDDTYRLLPYLFDGGDLAAAVAESPKPFLGFSDTTVNHLMLHKVGLPTFYGQSFLADVCELDREMLPYTRRYFEEWVAAGTVREVTPSALWYESRSDFSPAALGTATPAHPDEGFRLLQGPERFSGRILGGCVDTMYDIFNGERYPDMPALCREYGLFPPVEDWRGRLLLLETSEEKMPPEKYEAALRYLREAGVLRAVAGVLAGKPMDRAYEEEYKAILLRTLDDPAVPVLWNVNVGHALPRCILPFGPEARVDAQAQKISFAPSGIPMSSRAGS